jgi:CHASE1-domain containing sensor protein
VKRLQPSSRFARLKHNWPVLAAAIIGVLVTITAYLAFQWQEQRRIAGHAHFDASVYARILREGAQSYIHLNRDVAGLFSASIAVTPRQFASYIDNIHARQNHPGLGHIGYLPRVAPAQIAQFEAETRKTMPSYAVHSNHQDAGAAFPLLYAAPSDDMVKGFLGFDYAMVPERREAMQRAADLGQSVVTRKLAYLSSPAYVDYVFIFTPVYDAAKPAGSVVERRAALSGYVFSMFLLRDMVEGVMGAGFKQQFDLGRRTRSPIPAV